MDLLRKVNIIIATVMICFALLYFFIDSFELSFTVISPFLAIIFLLFGVEKVKEDDKKLGYFYIITGIIVFSGLIIDLFKESIV